MATTSFTSTLKSVLPYYSPCLYILLQVSNLFLSGSGTVVGLLCGGFDMSSAIMLSVKVCCSSL